MIEIITDEKLIAKYHKQFILQLKAICTEEIPNMSIGYREGYVSRNLFYSEKYNFWFNTTEYPKRHVNIFGLENPLNEKKIIIIIQMNIPYCGINRGIGGVFAYNSEGEIFLLHRGITGGGKKGMGKKYFLSNFKDNFVFAKDGDKESKFCVISSINSKHFSESILSFIKEAQRISKLKEQKFPIT